MALFCYCVIMVINMTLFLLNINIPSFVVHIDQHAAAACIREGGMAETNALQCHAGGVGLDPSAVVGGPSSHHLHRTPWARYLGFRHPRPSHCHT